MTQKITAYAWASGLIEFGNSVPPGALPIAKGDKQQIMDNVIVLARHSYNGYEIYVPGIPEADSQKDATDALLRFSNLIKERLNH
ncbi:host nuclease inhibitor protein [Edwardsiella piscicida]